MRTRRQTAEASPARRQRFERPLGAGRVVRSQDDSLDAGFTLIELMTAMLISSIAMALIVPVFLTMTNLTSTSVSTSNATAQARQALAQLNSDMSSANSNNICFPPAGQTAVSVQCPAGANSGSTVRVLSNVFNTCRWIQWTVTNSELTEQTWLPSWTSSLPTPAAVPLVGPVNTSSSLGSIFSLNTTGSLLAVQLTLQGSTTSAGGASSTNRLGSQQVTLQSSISLFTSTQAAGHC
jgi:prepilin-type N-terminal cleavage/methylation domain-containing protein